MQTEHLNILKRYFKKKRRLPSYSEMLKLFRVASKNSVFKIMQRFIAGGFIKKDGNRFSPTSKFLKLPLLGLVKAGFPIISEEDRKYITLDEYLIGDPVSSFLLAVSGDSLNDLGIFEGDIVIVERKKNASAGDIVLAEIDRNWTLKILKKDPLTKKSYLAAANSKYPPFYPREELMIHGVVKALIRKMH